MENLVYCDIEKLFSMFHDELRTGKTPSECLVHAVSVACKNGELLGAIKREYESGHLNTPGKRLLFIRNLRKFTMRDLRHIMSLSYISGLENEKKDFGRIPNARLDRLCDKLGIRIAWLLHGELPMKPNS